MKRPMVRGSEINGKRFSTWLAQFAGYRTPVTNGMIELWLRQFARADQDLAARILDAVLFITTKHIHTCFRDLLDSLPGWSAAKSKRKGRWFFVPFSGSVGESGDSMVHTFRMATSMSKKQFNELFIHRSELVVNNPGPEDTVVLIDDFSGTGKQACDSWKQIFAELLTGEPRVLLMMVAATNRALDRIAAETEVEPVCGTTLRQRDNLFHPECNHFTDAEKAAILRYCEKADRREPKGFHDSGLLIVFAHRCPNNSVPILHASSNQWQGLFPRHD